MVSSETDESISLSLTYGDGMVSFETAMYKVLVMLCKHFNLCHAEHPCI